MRPFGRTAFVPRFSGRSSLQKRGRAGQNFSGNAAAQGNFPCIRCRKTLCAVNHHDGLVVCTVSRISCGTIKRPFDCAAIRKQRKSRNGKAAERTRPPLAFLIVLPIHRQRKPRNGRHDLSRPPGHSTEKVTGAMNDTPCPRWNTLCLLPRPLGYRTEKPSGAGDQKITERESRRTDEASSRVFDCAANS